MHIDNEHFSFLSLLTMLGGLSVFLYGLELMSSNLRKSSGNTLKLVLEKATEHPLMGVAVGTLVTSIIQSSSATTSILVSLVQSHLMSFERTVGVIMGANIGTTITAQIVAFKVTHWALPIFLIGFIIQTFGKRTKTKSIGFIIMGLGLIFFGLYIMSAAMKALRGSEYFLSLMQSLENIPLGILVGAVFTALIQSSSATLGIMIGMASSGLISVEASVPVILGANLGTCVTAIFAALKTSDEAKRVAAAHILFNVGGVLLFAFWIPQFTKLVQLYTPPDDIPRLIANAQTTFNIMATVIWLPFTKQLQWLSEMIIKVEDNKGSKRRYLLPKASKISKAPDLSLIQSKDAIRYMKNLVKDIMIISRSYLINHDALQIDKIIELRNEQKELRADLIDYLSRCSRHFLSYKQTSDILNQTAVINEIEHIAHKIDVTFERMANNPPTFDEEDKNLEDYFRKTVKYFSKACNAFIHESSHDSKRIYAKLEGLKPFEDSFRAKYIESIYVDSHKKGGADGARINLELLEILRSINSTSKRICKVLMDQTSLVKH